MTNPNSLLLSSILFFFVMIIYSSSISVEALVPKAKTFNYVIQDTTPVSSFGVSVEYNANYRPLEISNYPFQLCFYNTTPDSFILGLGMGNGTYSLMRWVWAANHARPVRENAKLIFSSSGNLALVDADGRISWQTRTANKGVVDIQLLPNGNLVLLDKNGGFVWQSFHYPTDTLLVGQGLGPGTSITNKLFNGAYSMIVEGSQIGLFFKSPFSSKPLLYYYLIDPDLHDASILDMTFKSVPLSDGPDHATALRFEWFNFYDEKRYFATLQYNSTLSLFRLGRDGNVRVFTYYEMGPFKSAWEETSTEFSVETEWYKDRECLMPEKCGSLGICENNQCVACPTPKGLMGWSKKCKPSKLPLCNVGAANVSYYKIEGVSHFLSTTSEGEGPMKIGQCKKKCSNDCKCMAFFFRKDTSMCLVTAQLNTLRKALDSSSTERIAYVKYST